MSLGIILTIICSLDHNEFVEGWGLSTNSKLFRSLLMFEQILTIETENKNNLKNKVFKKLMVV